MDWIKFKNKYLVKMLQTFVNKLRTKSLKMAQFDYPRLKTKIRLTD
jgi:hypothetical protein